MTGVVAGRVGMPDVDEDVGNRLTCLDIDNADVHDLYAMRRDQHSSARGKADAGTYEE